MEKKNTIIIYYTDTPKNKINVVYLDTSWIDQYSAGFGMTAFGLWQFGDPA